MGVGVGRGSGGLVGVGGGSGGLVGVGPAVVWSGGSGTSSSVEWSQ